jgi:ankyrin repeat protein
MITRREAILSAATGAALLAFGCGKREEPQAQANPTEVKEFWDAMNDGDATIIDRLLKAKRYLANAKNESGQTPLAFAKSQSNDELARVIQKAGGRE